ncbi:YiiX/YebB-like N1pC/P60 family cysteine hydrolase [Pseudidiomarina terrestris]|uniref:Lipo-like protein n=1 Tax=Pseudidiomarina terrestris TaxID=2820060 RepID=A0AAW7QZI6_9GAMM|nr:MULTISPECIES: YiiX/YebB-like N1pC/P60 family cysteine hydrolase [unclassified Pseudidiomarina]MDN7123724.1 lipo-like protein [Pseudidiomarina sp. 1APP75-32.1]MDN7126486.1 lipo-like protein [Pseudidiomarina sp. 1APR75-33.1]MDN7128552.1 lipo-like protein [Pseudidiomarina sp. 1APR75-15]MDN7135190.1 lipo-like protein [Pseudidiomarina sp. 1ASP75-5]
MGVLAWFGKKIAKYLQQPSSGLPNPPTSAFNVLEQAIEVGDVLLVDGNSRIATAIKYLTQSTWSHATLCVAKNNDEGVMLLEADVIEGVRLVPLSFYQSVHTRICRPIGIRPEDMKKAVEFAKSRLGHQYDTGHILDLARYLIRTPPVPVEWRRSLLTFGSGDPTKAICSSLIAQAFQSIHYPILPEVLRQKLIKRHHSQYVPGDFDISPYFAIVKPSLKEQFDPYQLQWHEPSADP